MTTSVPVMNLAASAHQIQDCRGNLLRLGESAFLPRHRLEGCLVHINDYNLVRSLLGTTLP
jgi:hypothetical protein